MSTSMVPTLSQMNPVNFQPIFLRFIIILPSMPQSSQVVFSLFPSDFQHGEKGLENKGKY